MTGDAVRQLLAEISAREQAATKGPWTAEPDTGAGRVWVQRARRDFAMDCEPLFSVRDLRDTADEDVRREQYAQRERDAAFIADARSSVPRLAAALTAVLDEHKPEKRYQPWEACDHSWDTAQDAADYGSVALTEVSYFEVCAHCGGIEMDGENDRDYRESLWPCPTYRAVATALEEQL